jgi:hypothetical protein
MTRLVVIGILTAFVVLFFLGLGSIKESYKLLPISASNEGAPTQFSTWKDFKAPNLKFSVMVPSYPQNAKQTMKDPKTKDVRKYDMYVSEKDDGSLFMISLIQFPDSKETPEYIQKSVVNDLLASNPQNQLKSMKVGDYKGKKTLDFSIVNNDMTVDGMAFSDGDTLYLLSAIFKNSAYHPEEYQYFINSFDLTGGFKK